MTALCAMPYIYIYSSRVVFKVLSAPVIAMYPTAILHRVSNKTFISKLVRTRTSRLYVIVGLILASLTCWAVTTVYQVTIYGRRSSAKSRFDSRDERWPAPNWNGNHHNNQARYEVINHVLKENRTVWLPWTVGVWRIYISMLSRV